MIELPKFPYIGSFQNERHYFRSEDPLEEVWARIARYGSREHLRRSFSSKQDAEVWNEHLSYAEIRFRQAVEFRAASRKSSLLTSPLPLYYSFLSLERALLALGPEIISTRSHGLRFKMNKDLLTAQAVVTDGTFLNFLEWKEAGKQGEEISLLECLGHIVELEFDFSQQFKDARYVEPVRIEGNMGEEVSLRFLKYSGDLKANWQNEFATLIPVCTLGEKNCLAVSKEAAGSTYESVSLFADKYLMPPLGIINHSLWFMYRKGAQTLRWPRSAYYMCAMFILGSAVRYQPELMLEASRPDSDVGWLLRRFLSLAERYFPQLKLMESYGLQMYFSREGL